MEADRTLLSQVEATHLQTSNNMASGAWANATREETEITLLNCRQSERIDHEGVLKEDGIQVTVLKGVAEDMSSQGEDDEVVQDRTEDDLA